MAGKEEAGKRIEKKKERARQRLWKGSSARLLRLTSWQRARSLRIHNIVSSSSKELFCRHFFFFLVFSFSYFFIVSDAARWFPCAID